MSEFDSDDLYIVNDNEDNAGNASESDSTYDSASNYSGAEYADSYYSESDYSDNGYSEAANKVSMGFAIASLVCGIISVICCCVCGLTSVLGICGIVFGAISLRKEGRGKGLAIGGIVTGSIGVLLALVSLIMSLGAGLLPNYTEMLENPEQFEEYIEDYVDNL